MSKKLIPLLFLVPLLLFSGCTDNIPFISSQGGESVPLELFEHYAEISTHSVHTEWKKQLLIWDTETRTESGFYTDFPEEGTTSYVITGTVKNIGSKPLTSVTIRFSFLDDLGNPLKSTSQHYSNIYVSQSAPFEYRISQSELYFSHVSDYSLEITEIYL